MTYRPAPEIIRDVFTAAAVELAKVSIVPYYDYGTTLEVVNRLKAKSISDKYDEKYPLVWMLIDDSVHEKVDVKTSVHRQLQDTTIVICTQSNQEYTSAERYTNIITPILRPIYEELMNQFKISKLTSSIGKYTHDYYENLFWGRSGLYGREGNIFDDRIDAIIIDNLQLLLINNC